MTKEMTNASIANRLAEKIKNSPFGELIDDEDMYDLVKTALFEAFFTPSKKTGEYGRITETPPLVVEVAREVLAEEMRAYTKDWLAKQDDDFKEKLLANLKEMLDDLTPQSIAKEMFSAMIFTPLSHFRNDMVNRATDILNGRQR